jgi:hypothetical protein
MAELSPLKDAEREKGTDAMETGQLQKIWRELCGVDRRSMAVFRVGIAVMLLIDLSIRGRDLLAFYSDDGAFPRALQLFTDSTHPFSLHMLSGSVGFQALLFSVSALFAVSLLVGYRTRLASIGCWVLLISMHGRNPLLLNGGDDLLVCVLFWAIFLPLGSCFSVDRARATEDRNCSNLVASVASLAVLVQIAAIYVTGAMLKSGAPWTEDGTALYYVMNIDWEVRSTAQYLLEYPELMKAMTISVWYFELYGPLLLFFPFFTGPLRTVGAIAFMGMHMNFNLFMELGLFAYIDIVVLTLFLPPWFWRMLPRRTLTVPAGLAGLLERVPRRPQARYGWANHLVVLPFAVCAALSAFGSVKPEYRSATAQAVVEPMLLNQDWSMFAPQPGLADGWFVFPGQLRNGDELNLYTWFHDRREAPVSFEKPDVIHATFKTNRWSDYFAELLAYTTDLAEEEGLDEQDVLQLIDRYWTPLLAHVCDDWNEGHPKDRSLQQLTAVFMSEITPPPGEPLEVEKIVLHTHVCADGYDPLDAGAATGARTAHPSLTEFVDDLHEDGGWEPDRWDSDDEEESD